MNQIEAGVERNLDVEPKVNHRIKLEAAPTVDEIQAVIMKEVENDILS